MDTHPSTLVLLVEDTQSI